MSDQELEPDVTGVEEEEVEDDFDENDNVVGSDDNDSDTDGNLKQKLAGSPPITPSHVSLDLYLNL